MGLIGLHHIQFATPDIEKTLAFLEDFGLLDAEEAGGRHYLRTCGSARYQVVVEAATEVGLRSVALQADSYADLEEFARRAGVDGPTPLDAPGGGHFVELTDPDGKLIRIVHGISERASDAAREPMVVNYGTDKKRKGTPQNFAPLGPAQLLRLGHVGLFARDMKACHAWYRDVLGLLSTDLMHAGPSDNVVTGFYRVDRGEEWVDHHTIALFGFGKSDLHHVSFEVQDSESQFMAHRWLTRREHESIWGVGRHPRGSHVFDVWRAPGGYRFETFTDTDQFTASHSADLLPVEKMEIDIWRDRNHEDYFS